MGVEKNQRKTVVWQDIRPTQPAKKPRKKIQLPPIKKHLVSLKTRLLKLRHRKIIVIGAGVVALLLAIGIFFFVTSGQRSTSTDISGKPVLEHGTPEYATILPSGKSASDFGGWTRVSPPDRNPVFAYADTIDRIPITVSEQPIPDDFKVDTAQNILQLAQEFNAKEKLSVAGMTIYIGSSSDGAQSVIFGRGDLLVLIKSNARISNDQWTHYITSLK